MRLLPWIKAPVLLFRRPGVVIALLVASVVAAVPAAGTPLLISASESDSIDQQLSDQCVLPGGFYSTFERSGQVVSDGADGSMITTVTIDSVDREDVLAEVDRVEGLAAQIDGVAEVDRTFALGSPQPWSDSYGRIVGVQNGEGGFNGVFLMYRDDLLDTIDPVAAGSGPGAWLPTGVSAVEHLEPGDDLATMLVGKSDAAPQPWDHAPGVPTDYTPGSEPANVRLPVAGFYESFGDNPKVKDHWCYMEYGLSSHVTPDLEWRPTIMLDDEETFWALAEQAELNVQVHLRFELEGSPSPDEAAVIAADVAAIEPDVTSTGTTMQFEMDRFVQHADLVADALWLPIGVVSGAAVLVGLCIVGAAAVLWVRRREIELRALAGRGVSPAALGAKGVLEALPAIVAGVVIGYILCWVSLPWWAPSDLVDPAAVTWSMVFAVAAALLALLVVGVVSGRATRRFTDPVKAGRRRMGVLPWEVLPLAGAAAGWWLLDDSIAITAGDAADRVGQVTQLPGRVFVVPLLVAVACAGAVARLMHWRWRRPGWLTHNVSGSIAEARIRRDRLSSAVMVAAVAVPTALAGYAITASHSVGETIDAQARYEIGSDVVVDFAEPADIGDQLARFGAATPVVRVDSLSLDQIRVSTLFVDPDTFAEAADTASAVAAVDLAEILTGEPVDGVPAVAIGKGTISNGSATVHLPGPTTMDVDVTTVPGLPGGRSGNPVVLISAEHMPELPWASGYQWWIRADDPAAARDFVQSAHPDAEVVLAAERYEGTPKQSLTASIDYLLWVSILTAVVVVVGILLRLESRSGANRRAFVMMRRMGLRSREHRLALLREIGSLLVIGVVCGTGIAAVLTAAMSGDFSTESGGGPGVLVAVPMMAVVSLVAATVVTVCFAGLFAHARIAAAKPSLVLRDTA